MLTENSKLSVPQSPMVLAFKSACWLSRSVKTPFERLPVLVENDTGGIGPPSGSVITTSPTLVALLVLLSSARLETVLLKAMAVGSELAVAVDTETNAPNRQAAESRVCRRVGIGFLVIGK